MKTIAPRTAATHRFLRRDLILSGLLVLIAIIFTILVAVVDVAPIGPDGSPVGFAALNRAFRALVGEHPALRLLTDGLGVLIILLALFYAGLGLAQLIRRRSLRRVDPALLALGGFYIVVGAIYLLFEQLAINFRPDALEPSYPSSHTLLALCVCLSAVIVNRRLCAAHFRTAVPRVNAAAQLTGTAVPRSSAAVPRSRAAVSHASAAAPHPSAKDPHADTAHPRVCSGRVLSLVNALILALALATVLGRMFCGSHWLSDIVGGVLISAALLSLFYTALSSIPTPQSPSPPTH